MKFAVSLKETKHISRLYKDLTKCYDSYIFYHQSSTLMKMKFDYNKIDFHENPLHGAGKYI